MNDEAVGAVYWSFWAIGAVALIWNVMGVINFLTQMNATCLPQCPKLNAREWRSRLFDLVFEAGRLVNAVGKVTDFEDVRIGLGTFAAFKIERDARFRNVDQWMHIYYWSLQTRSVVKYQMEVLKGAAAGSTREITLVKFGSAR